MKLRPQILGILSLLAMPALSQISTEAPPRERTLPVAGQVEQDMARARFRLGPLRLLPFLAISDMGWTNNALVTSEGQVDDVTASASAGAKLIVPFGQKMFLRGVVAPTYDWYYKAENLRSFGGSYSGEFLGLFNRLTFGAGGGYEERISTVSSEVARDVFNKTTTANGKVELKILERLSIFGGADLSKLRQEDPSANTPGLSPVSYLNRTESALRAGLRYTFSSTLSFGVMGEEVATRFEENGSLQDNDVRGLLFVARYDKERLYLEGTVGVREGKAVTPNEFFPEYRAGTYGYFASYFVTRACEIVVRGSRRPYASLFLDNPYYFETRNGVAVRLAVGRRFGFNALGELGSNRYVNPVLVTATGEIVTRIDDTTRYGGGFDYRVSRAVSLGFLVTQERYASNIDYYDRTVVRISGGLRISADFARDEERR